MSEIETRDKMKIVLDDVGNSLVVPTKFPTHDAVQALRRHQRQEEEEIDVNEEVDAFPLDGARALMTVLKRRYTLVSTEAVQTFFGTQNPDFVSVEVDHEKTEQVIWGRLRVPGVEGVLHCGKTRKNGRFIFVIGGSILRKSEKEVKEIAEDVRREVRENSIYKGKPIFLNSDENGKLKLARPPGFLDLSRVQETDLIFSSRLDASIRTNIFTPIRYSQQCRDVGVPLKRGVILVGTPGTGKTFTAYVTAKLAVQNGWTFVYLDKVQALEDGIMFARRFQPAVVFAEDLDRIVGPERTDEVNAVLNIVDGISNKDSEIMVVLTTNHLDRIHKTMTRPGRLDAIIQVEPPDAEAAEKLMRLYGRGLVPENENLSAAAQVMEGQIPAALREVMERSKLSEIDLRNERAKLGKFDLSTPMSLSGDAVHSAAVDVKTQIELGEFKPEDHVDTVDIGLRRLIEQVFDEKVSVTVPSKNGDSYDEDED